MMRVAGGTNDLFQSAFSSSGNEPPSRVSSAPMNSVTRLLPAVLLACCASAAHADETKGPLGGPTYRSVGPDGKVTFTDRKPTDPQQRTRQLGQTVTAPLVGAASGPFDLHPATTMPPHPPAAEGTTPPVDVSGKPFPPGLPDAILDVLVHQYFVQTLNEACVRQRPALAERFQTGVRNWRDRNAEILDKSNRISFARFTAEQRDILRAAARTRLAQLVPGPELAEPERAAWCDRMGTDLARRQFELVGDLRVAPILYFDGL